MNNRFFSQVEAFVAVARHGSFTDAAAELRVSKSSVSHKLAELERQLDVVLLRRTTRKIEITPAGQKALRSCARAVDATHRARFEIGLPDGSKGPVSGVVTVSGPNVYLTKNVVSLLDDFWNQYPDIRINLIGSDRPANLREDNIDLRIRIGAIPAKDMKAWPLMSLRRILCANPAIDAGLSGIEHPRQLARFPAILREQEKPTWELQRQDQVCAIDITAPRMTVNSYELCCQAVKDGIGMAVLAETTIQTELAAGQILRILPEWDIRDIPVSLLARRSRMNRPHVRAVQEFLRARLEK